MSTPLGAPCGLIRRIQDQLHREVNSSNFKLCMYVCMYVCMYGSRDSGGGGGGSSSRY